MPLSAVSQLMSCHVEQQGPMIHPRLQLKMSDGSDFLNGVLTHQLLIENCMLVVDGDKNRLYFAEERLPLSYKSAPCACFLSSHDIWRSFTLAHFRE
jgi:hypothetical protein